MSRRLALLAGGLLAGFIALEVALQSAAVVRGWFEVPRRTEWRDDGATRVLAVGDSNTYGLWVEPHEAYPRVFETQWNLIEPADRRVEVMNLGRPGASSAHGRKLAEAALAAHHPAVVFVMIGANDFWTSTEADTPAWKRLRVVRLLTMLWVYLTRRIVVPLDTREQVDVGGRTVEIDFVGSDEVSPDWQPRMLDNLRAIVAAARAASTQVVLLTYPADDDVYGTINQVIRRFARSEKVPLVDVALGLRRACPAGGKSFAGTHSRCGLLFPDGHPTVAGHAAVGQQLAAAYRRMRDGGDPSHRAQ